MSIEFAGECVCGTKYRFTGDASSPSRKCARCGRPLRLRRASALDEQSAQSEAGSPRAWWIFGGVSAAACLITLAAVTILVGRKQPAPEPSNPAVANSQPAISTNKKSAAVAASPSGAQSSSIGSNPASKAPELPASPATPARQSVVAGWPVPVTPAAITPAPFEPKRHRHQPLFANDFVAALTGVSISGDGNASAAVRPTEIANGLLGFSLPPETFEVRTDSKAERKPLLTISGTGELAGAIIGPVSIQPGKRFRAAGEVRLAQIAGVDPQPRPTDNGETAHSTATVQLDFYDAQGNLLESVNPGSLPPAQASDWTSLCIAPDAAPPPPQATFVGASVLLRGPGQLQVRRLELVATDATFPSGNLMPNGDAESFAGRAPFAWWLYQRNNPQAALQVSELQPIEGSRCLRLTGHGELLEAQSKRIRIDREQAYRLTGSVRVAKGGAGLQLLYWTDKFAFAGKSAAPATSSAAWKAQTVSSELDKFPTAVWMSVSVIGRGDADVFADGLQLVAIPKSAADSPPSNKTDGSPAAESRWYLAHDGSGTPKFSETSSDGTVPGSVLHLTGDCKWAVVSARERIAIESGKSYVFSGESRRNSGEALLKIDYYQGSRMLGRTYSKPAGKVGEWARQAVESELSKYPQATHLVAAVVGRGKVDAQFRKLELKAKAP